MRIDFKQIVLYLKGSVDDGDTILADLGKIHKNGCQKKGNFKAEPTLFYNLKNW